MFTERGSYTLTLTLEDTNGNKKTVTKKEIIKII
jgi:PKD repeat protein